MSQAVSENVDLGHERNKDAWKSAQKAGTYCFWAAVLIELLLVIIDKSAYINPYEGQLFRLTFLLFAVKILTTKYSRNEILFLGMVGMVAAVSYFVNTKDEAVRAVALVAACKDIDLRRLLKVVLCATIAGMAVLFVLSVTGIYGAVSVTADYGRVLDRWTLIMRRGTVLGWDIRMRFRECCLWSVRLECICTQSACGCGIFWQWGL